VIRSSLRRRYRLCEDVATDLKGLVPFVAVLPDLGRGEPLTAAAARCVHDLRVRLQPTGPDNPRTYLVTSASAGECKTSLSLALGLSFAAAGFRTLLIDGDLTTRQLSLGLDAGDQPGVIEAIAGGEPAIRRIRSGLSILPAGNSRPQDACRLSPTGTARMLASLHDRFDVVLIDGDPVLTGITASVIAPQAGGVIVTMNRGQDQPLVQSAIRQLGMLGAELAGAVFNRAAAGEFPTSVKDQPGLGGPTERLLPERLNRFGPIVGAVLTSLSLTRDTDLDLMAPGMSLAQTDEEARFKAPEVKKNIA
jgi:Mrp family chromosome partitioning ATPase